MELAVKHLFEHVSLKRELHIAGMLLRRGIARVSVAEALAWAGGGKEWVIRHPLVGASEEQNQAVHHVLGSKNFITSFAGPAGAGKTELMTEAVTAIESLSAKHVMILAPSSPSVEVLRAQGFANTDTLQQFLMNRDLQQAAIGQVLWVDEAGFLSVRQMLELEEFAIDHDCRLIVTGDTKAN
jgi:AAA domain